MSSSIENSIASSVLPKAIIDINRMSQKELIELRRRRKRRGSMSEIQEHEPLPDSKVRTIVRNGTVATVESRGSGFYCQ